MAKNFEYFFAVEVTITTKSSLLSGYGWKNGMELCYLHSLDLVGSNQRCSSAIYRGLV